MSETFELSLLGGAVERRWRKLRPEIERMPWDTLDPATLPPSLVAAGRRFWTLAAFQEHRTAASCAVTLNALLQARAPIDLVAMVARFVEDELAHVELCARVAAQLGGGAPIAYDPKALCPLPSPSLSPFAAACELVLRIYCVGEAFSVPMQRATARAEEQPLLRAVVQRIAKDEAKHGAFGWIFFDWAGELIDAPTRAHLRHVARTAVAGAEKIYAAPKSHRGPRIGWLDADDYVREARRALDEDVIAPLVARDLY